MSELVAAVVGGVAGAGVGSGLSYWLPRAKPLVIVKSVRLSTSSAKSARYVSPAEILMNDLRAFPEKLDPPDPLRRIPEDQYVADLRRSQHELSNARFTVDRLLETERQLESLVSQEDTDQARALYQSSQMIWTIVETANTFGPEIEWDDTPQSDRVARKARRVVEEEHSGGCFMVDTKPQPLHFPYGYRQGPALDRAKALSKRVATAFAEDRRTDLLTYFRYFRHQAPSTLAEAERLSHAIDDELSRYDRVIVELLVANSGRLPFVLTGTATLSIELRGYSFSGPGRELDAASRSQTVRENVSLKCTAYRVPQQSEDSDEWMEDLSSLLVDSGGAERRLARARIRKYGDGRPRSFGVVSGKPQEVLCISDLTLQEMPVPDAIRASHLGGEREARLTLGIVRPGTARPGTLGTPRFLFADVEHSALPRAQRRSGAFGADR